MAVTAAMETDDFNVVCVRDTYTKRCDIIVESFSKAGWNIPLPDVTMVAGYQYCIFRHLDSFCFFQADISRAEMAVSLWIDFCDHGDTNVSALVERTSVVYDRLYVI